MCEGTKKPLRARKNTSEVNRRNQVDMGTGYGVMAFFTLFHKLFFFLFCSAYCFVYVCDVPSTYRLTTEFVIMFCSILSATTINCCFVSLCFLDGLTQFFAESSKPQNYGARWRKVHCEIPAQNPDQNSSRYLNCFSSHFKFQQLKFMIMVWGNFLARKVLSKILLGRTL